MHKILWDNERFYLFDGKKSGKMKKEVSQKSYILLEFKPCSPKYNLNSQEGEGISYQRSQHENVGEKGKTHH